MEYLKDAACISVFIFQAGSVKEAQGSQYATVKLFLGNFSSLRAGFKQRSFLRLGPQPLEALRPHFSIKKTMALSWSQCHYEYRFHDARLASKVSLQEPAVWVQQCPIQKVLLLPNLFLTSLFVARGAVRMRVCLQAMIFQMFCFTSLGGNNFYHNWQ